MIDSATTTQPYKSMIPLIIKSLIDTLMSNYTCTCVVASNTACHCISTDRCSLIKNCRERSGCRERTVRAAKCKKLDNHAWWTTAIGADLHRAMVTTAQTKNSSEGAALRRNGPSYNYVSLFHCEIRVIIVIDVMICSLQLIYILYLLYLLTCAENYIYC